ncbi:MAG: CAP domain-containing protein [Alphaproteobacteria bacterium]
MLAVVLSFALPCIASAAEDAAATALLARVNSARAQAKLPPLALNVRLAEAAQAHAEDMAAMGRLSHEGSDGAALDVRLARAGYRYRFAAENVAAGLVDPARTVEQWMASPGHRRNILAREASEAGIGYVEPPQGAPYRAYWVLILARPL